MAVLGLCFCARAFSSCGKWGATLHRDAWASHYRSLSCAEHRLQTHKLSICGSRAQLLCGMWDLPRPGLKPVSPALAGRLSTTAPPGKAPNNLFLYLKQLKKEKQTKPKVSGRKEIINIRAEINEIETKKIAKINETKSWFFEKNKIVKKKQKKS